MRVIHIWLWFTQPKASSQEVGLLLKLINSTFFLALREMDVQPEARLWESNLGRWCKVQYVTQTQNIGVIKIKDFQKIVGSLFLSCSKKGKDAFCFCPQGSFTPVQCPGLGSCSPIWGPAFQEGGCVRVKGEKAAAIKQHQL